MANIFEKIGRKVKDAALGAYHQVNTRDNGQTFRSYQEEEERRRRLREQQQQQRMAARNQQRQQIQAAPKPQTNQPRLSVSAPSNQIKLSIAPVMPQPKIVVPKVPQPARPAQVKPRDNRNLFQKAYDQVNPQDAGRSFKTAVPDAKAAKQKTIARKVGDFADDVATEIVRAVPNVAVSAADQGTRQGTGAQAKTIKQLKSLSYDERRRLIATAQRDKNNGLPLVLQNIGINLNDPSDEALDRALGGVQKTRDKGTTFQPGNRVEKFFLGDKELQSYQKRGLGIEDATSIPAPIAATGLFGLDFAPGGKNTAAITKKLAKTTDNAAVRELLNSQGLQVLGQEAEEIASKIAGSTSRKDISRYIESLTKRQGGNAASVGQDGIKLAEDTDFNSVRDRIRTQAQQLRDDSIRIADPTSANVTQPLPQRRPNVAQREQTDTDRKSVV